LSKHNDNLISFPTKDNNIVFPIWFHWQWLNMCVLYR